MRQGKAIAVAVIGLAALLGACKATSTSNINHGTFREVPTSVVLPQTFDDTWDRLAAVLTAPPYGIEEIDHAGGLIAVVFETDGPGAFVDCGESIRSFESQGGSADVYRYAIAEDSSYKAADDKGRAYGAERTTWLESVTRVTVAPVAEGTEITIGTDFVFAEETDIDGLDPREAGVTASQRAEFRTNGQSQGALRCVSTGVLEDRILAAGRIPS